MRVLVIGSGGREHALAWAVAKSPRLSKLFVAAGKGVRVAENLQEAEDAVRDCFAGAFGASGATVVIEEFLQGEEISVFALCDGHDIVILASAQDHKRVWDGDKGPNTGGMGAYS